MAKEYKDQILDTSVNTKRVYNIVDSDGNIVAENISFEDKTVYSQEGTEFGAQEVNEIYEAIDEVNQSLNYSSSNLLWSGTPESSAEITLSESIYNYKKIIIISGRAGVWVVDTNLCKISIYAGNFNLCHYNSSSYVDYVGGGFINDTTLKFTYTFLTGYTSQYIAIHGIK